MPYILDAHGIRWPGDGLQRSRLAPGQVRICRAFLEQCQTTKTTGIGSYALKHVIERWADHYIANGACIQAALDLGIGVTPVHTGYSLLTAGKFFQPRPLNAWIHVGRASVRKIAGRKGNSK